MDSPFKVFIVQLSESLRDDADIKVEETLQTLADFREQLEEFFQKYNGDVPKGAEEMQELMLQSLTLFYGALDDLDEFIEDPDDELLDGALEQANEADVILNKAAELASQVSAQNPVFG